MLCTTIKCIIYGWRVVKRQDQFHLLRKPFKSTTIDTRSVNKITNIDPKAELISFWTFFFSNIVVMMLFAPVIENILIYGLVPRCLVFFLFISLPNLSHLREVVRMPTKTSENNRASTYLKPPRGYVSKYKKYRIAQKCLHYNWILKLQLVTTITTNSSNYSALHTLDSNA